MTFDSSAWAIDGARTKARSARAESYSATGSAEGVVGSADLKVRALDVPGVGLQIDGGSALILNRYQDTINQTYTVFNDDVTVLEPADMPAPQATEKSYLVCVTIGDPEFSQLGHPWMTSEMPAVGEEPDFQYVRPFIVGTNVTSNTKNFAQLGLKYPAYALARLTIPANTSTITDEMLVDLRKLARPRSLEEIFTMQATGGNLLNGAGGIAGQWETWPSAATFSVDVPSWATKAKVQAIIEGARQVKAGNAQFISRFVGGNNTTFTDVVEPAPAVARPRKTYNVFGSVAIPASHRGTTRTIRLEGRPMNDASKGMMDTDASTSAMIRVRFEEDVI